MKDSLSYFNMMKAPIERASLCAEVNAALRRSPVVALLGPRQCGKTTMARSIVPVTSPNYFDLEDPVSLARLDEPMTTLSSLRGLVVIDEVQRRPELFPALRVLVDQRPRRLRFLVLGSASPELLRQTSESLAGRIEHLEMTGFSLQDVGYPQLDRHWRRGGFPSAWLPRAETDSVRWRVQFVQTLLERDLPHLGIRTSAVMLRRFWAMLAHYHGNVWNAAEPARSLGVSQPTVRHYLDLLTGLFVIRQLQPWHANLLKRQVRAPKIYVRDSGLLHVFLGARTANELAVHPKLGASWEGYVIERLLETIPHDDAFFWATHAGAELDLMIQRGGRRYGFEIKREDAPKMTPSIRTAITDLDLTHLTVVYPGSKSYQLASNVTVQPLVDLLEASTRLGRRL